MAAAAEALPLALERRHTASTPCAGLVSPERDMIYATPSDQFPHPRTPIRMLSIIDRMIGAEVALKVFG